MVDKQTEDGDVGVCSRERGIALFCLRDKNSSSDKVISFWKVFFDLTGIREGCPSSAKFATRI
jgi:hypothetical protein